MPEWVMKRLSSFGGDRRLFTSGDAALDRFFHQFAGQYEKRRIRVTWVATPKDVEQVAGYCTSAASSVPFEAVPIKLGRHPIPTILLARLAVDQTFRGQGVGEHLLFHGLKHALDVSSGTAVWAVTVDAYESAVPFYARYGFQRLLIAPAAETAPGATRTVPMFLSMKDIEKFSFKRP